MFLLKWLRTPKTLPPRKNGLVRTRASFGQTTLPLISPRHGRRILRREQLFSVVRESLIRGGVLSTSYEFKVLTLDASGDGFLVLIDLALPAEAMPDEYLLEIERWIQSSAQSRHEMVVRAVYWRRKAARDQRGMALKAARVAQTRHDPVTTPSPTNIPAPRRPPDNEPVQPVSAQELDAFRRALQSAEFPLRRAPQNSPAVEPIPESLSDFSALSQTQHGKL